MATAKTADRKRSREGKPGDTNIKQLTMGHWTNRSMRAVKSGAGKGKGRASRKAQIPPPGGWKPEHFK